MKTVKTFLLVLFIAFITLSLEIDTEKFSQDDSKVEKDFISRLAFWLPDDKSEEELKKEQDDYLKNAETLDLSAIEKATRAIEGQSLEQEDLLALDAKYKEIIEEPQRNEEGAKELSQPFFEDSTIVVEERSPKATTQTSDASTSSLYETTQEQSTLVSEEELIETVQSPPKATIEVDELHSTQIGLEGYEVTRTPSLVITNFTLRNMVESRHRGVFSFALILEDGQKEYLELSPATYNFLRIVAKNYEIPIPERLSKKASRAYGFLLEVKNQNNKLLLSKLYTF